MEYFAASRLKIERAKQHINDLHSRILDFADSGFYALSVDKNTKTGNYGLKIEVRKSFPNDYALIIGDAAHNLKSALDVLANEVVFRRLGRYDKHRLLLPVMQVTSIVDFCAEDDRGNKWINATLVVTRNRTVTVFESSGNIKITNNGKTIPLVLFDKGLPMEGQTVVPSLIRLTELVSGIVDGIETVFLSETI